MQAKTGKCRSHRAIQDRKLWFFFFQHCLTDKGLAPLRHFDMRGVYKLQESYLDALYIWQSLKSEVPGCFTSFILVACFSGSPYHSYVEQMSSEKNRYWIPNLDINKKVITEEIQYYLGPESTVRPYTREVLTL